MLDDISLKILKILQEKARIPNVEIARRIEMAPSAVLERIRSPRFSRLGGVRRAAARAYAGEQILKLDPTSGKTLLKKPMIGRRLEQRSG